MPQAGVDSGEYEQVPAHATPPLHVSVTSTDAVALFPAVSKTTAWKLRVSLATKLIGNVWLICAHDSANAKVPFCALAWSGP